MGTGNAIKKQDIIYELITSFFKGEENAPAM